VLCPTGALCDGVDSTNDVCQQQLVLLLLCLSCPELSCMHHCLSACASDVAPSSSISMCEAHLWVCCAHEY
jgi:hypothetical protein